MSLGNFFGGLSQGFGSTLFQGQQAQLEKKEREKMLTYQGLQGLFNKAADEGDNKAAADIYEHMGEVIGDKKMHPFVANILRNTQPQIVKEVTPEAQAAQANINQLQTNQQSNSSNTSNTLVGVPPSPGYDRQNMNQPAGGIVKNIEVPTTNNKPTIEYNPLLDAERPRKAIGERITQQGFFATPEEKQQRALGMKIKEEEALLPIELKKYKAQREVAGDIFRQNKESEYKLKEGLEDKKAENQGDLARIKAQAKLEADNEFNKYLYSLTGGSPQDATPEQVEAARNHATDYYNTLVEKNKSIVERNKAQASDYATRHPDRVAANATRQQAINNAARDFSSKDTYRQWLMQHGDAKLAQDEVKVQQQYGDKAAILQKLKNAHDNINNIEHRQNHFESILANPLTKDESVITNAQEEIQKANKEYDMWQNEVNNLTGQLYNTGNNIMVKKTLTKNKPVDPLGIR